MGERRMQASEFKARCLAVLDEVATTHTEIVVTKHGRPVARLVPIQRSAPTEGSVTLLVDDDELYFSTGESWDAER
ncbi:MAG: type II toxin-antitoxin system Phd/YefM family antitoxin [Pseudonocardia sp.]